MAMKNDPKHTELRRELDRITRQYPIEDIVSQLGELLEDAADRCLYTGQIEGNVRLKAYGRIMSRCVPAVQSLLIPKVKTKENTSC